MGTQRERRPLLLPLLPASGQQTRTPSGAPPPAPDPFSLDMRLAQSPRFLRVRVLGAWRAPRRCAKEGGALPVQTWTHRECGSCYHSPFSRRRWGAAPGLQGITALFTSTPLWPRGTLPGSSKTRYKGGKRQVVGAGWEAEVREPPPVVLPTRSPLRLLVAREAGGPADENKPWLRSSLGLPVERERVPREPERDAPSSPSPGGSPGTCVGGMGRDSPGTCGGSVSQQRPESSSVQAE